MKNKLLWIVIGLVVVGLILAGLGVLFLNRPLGPGLKLTPLALAAVSAPAAGTQTASGAETQAASIPPPVTVVSTAATSTAPFSTTPNANPTVQAKPVCGSGAMTILLLGESSPNPGERRGADAIRLLRIDFERQAVTILSIPPGLWVNTSAIPGSDSTTLTRAYYQVKTTSSGSAREAIQRATQVIAQALLDNFGFTPDHYLIINEPVFVSLVNTLGGIEVNLKERIDGSAEGRGVFEAGRQVFTGKRTLDYIRITKPNNQPESDEWGRFKRQNQVIAALRNEITKPENAAAIPSLVSQFYQLVVTDLSPAQLLDLNCMIAAVGENTTMLQVGADMVTFDSQGHMIPDETKIRSLIETSLNQ
ncbi:MAG TPA: LCP family protein [Anaerolineales bacterium]|nr:LCP family protein [Anaerolineales bacterium]